MPIRIFRVAFENRDNAIVDLLVIEFSGADVPSLLDASAPRSSPMPGGNAPVLHRLLVN